MGRRTRELILAAVVCGGIAWALFVPAYRAYVLEPGMRSAVERMEVKAVRRLASLGADVNLDLGPQATPPQPDPFAVRTPLRVAIQRNDRDTLRFLIRRGADVERRNRSGDTPLIYAINQGRVELASELLAAGAGANTPDQWGYPPLVHAIRWWNPQHPEDSVALVRLLLRHGADPSIVADDFTALACAEEEGAGPLVELLRRPGCADRKTCLERIAAKGPLYATRSEHLDAVKLLVRRNVSFRVQDEKGTSLMAAASEFKQKLLPYLLQHARGIDRAFLNTRVQGDTALTLAAYEARWANAKALLAAGADPDLVDARGRTALHYAAIHGAAGMLPFFLAAGASLNVRDASGLTPLDEAKDRRRIAMIRSLREAGASEQATDMRSRRAHEALRRR